MPYTMPSPLERRLALGRLDDLPEQVSRLFQPDGDFAPMPEPGPEDWLALNREPGQTFADFLATERNVPDSTRRFICLLPLGRFPPGESPPLPALRDYAEAYFRLETRLMEPARPGRFAFASRFNPLTGRRQVKSTDILAWLIDQLPRDCFALLAVTMDDLYPEPLWNYVFGQASLRDRVGVFSFARYDPAFFGKPRGPEFATTLLRRSCRVLVHETAHMFSIAHCPWYRCVMNGSNHLEESDARPLSMCPVDLRKLHAAVGFDPVDRYLRLHDFYCRHSLHADAAWTGHRLRSIGH